MSTDTMIIAIAGASASGKSLLANTITEELGSDQVVIISEDSYYKDRSNLSFKQREKINYDHPDAFDHDLMCQHLEQLRQGESVQVPIYDYTQHTRTDQTKTVGQHTIIVLEGILLLSDAHLRDLFNISIFMDTPLDVCLIRRLQRDVKERGRSLDSVIEQYQTTVRPMYNQFIEPSKRNADLIVPHGGKNRIAIELIQAKMRELIGHQLTEKNSLAI